jgi:small subunit ribosomal protein S4e
MARKGGLGHLKRLPAPWFWPIHRKEAAWAPKPIPGAHKSEQSLPLALVLRNELGVAKTRKEIASILSHGKVKIDGRPRTDMNYPVGLMDVVELPDANLAYRALPVERRGLKLIKIPKDEAKFKLCKVLRKTVTREGIQQYGLHDGRTLLSTSKEGQTATKFSTNDTLRISVPTQRVLNQIKFEKGNSALVVAGRNLGRSGKIVELQQGTATRPAMVTIEDSTGSKFDTMADYTFVVGTDKSTIKLEAT